MESFGSANENRKQKSANWQSARYVCEVSLRAASREGTQNTTLIANGHSISLMTGAKEMEQARYPSAESAQRWYANHKNQQSVEKAIRRST